MTIYEAALRQASPTFTERISAYAALTKPRIVELLLVTTLPAMVLAAGGIPRVGLAVGTIAGGALAAGGANAANMALDGDIDRIMSRTSRRPVAAGVITPRQAAIFAIVLEVAAFVLLYETANLFTALLSLGAALFYVFVYTLWLKRRSSQNIVIGGAAGAVPVLAGWVAVRNDLSLAALVMFGVVFLWTPPHFWALALHYRDDYEAANVPMLPVKASRGSTTAQILAYSVALWICSLALIPAGHMGIVYSVAALAAGGAFCSGAWKLHRSRDGEGLAPMRLFHWSIGYLAVLFVAIAVDVLARHH